MPTPVTPAAVTIDAAWLTAHGPAPYVLAANTVYTLAVDVNVASATFAGPPFTWGDDRGVRLVPNGHPIRVNGLPACQLLDSDMNGDSGRSTIRVDEAAPIRNYAGSYWMGAHPSDITPPGSPYDFTFTTDDVSF